MVDTDGPYGLLLRHFTAWATTKREEVDVDLLAELIRLRESYDDLEPTYWPAGSVEHLLLERWPSKGDVDAPDESSLVETLDAWFRFLRSTGRMSGRSADPKELAREARRAAPRMSEVAGDRAHWSSGKVVLEFGKSIGLDVDDLADEADLPGRLAQIQDAWNSLPEAERHRLMPNLSGQDGGDDRTDEERLLDRYGVDDPIVALLMSFDDRLPGGKLPPAEVTGPQFASAPYVRQVLALAEWAREGREVTPRDVLRLAPSREVYAELGLDAWTRDQLDRMYPDETLPGVAAVGRERWTEDLATRPWQSAADCEALDRLWWGGVLSGLLRLDGKRVLGHPVVPEDAQGWVGLGTAICAGLMDRLASSGGRLRIVVQALMTSYVGRRSPVSKVDLVQFDRDWYTPPSFRDHDEFSSVHAASINEAIGWISDTGLVEETDDAVCLTEAGDAFVTWWLDHMRDKFRSSPG